MAGFIAGISFLSAVVFFILGIVALIKRNKKAKKRFGLFAALIVVGVIFVQLTDSAKETRKQEEAKQAAAQVEEEKKAAFEKRKKIAAETAKKKAAIQAIENFEADVQKNITDKSNGVIQTIIFDKTNSLPNSTPLVRVFVSTDSYLNSSESEKKLFATDVDQKVTSWAIKNKVSGAKDFGVLTDIYDMSTRSELMSEKPFGGYKIKQ